MTDNTVTPPVGLAAPAEEPHTIALRYAGFWPRLGALLLDIVLLAPLGGLAWWGYTHVRLLPLYFAVPDVLVGLLYNVYLVQRFGGTPGKLIVGIRIRKVNGSPVGYREAFLRYLPEFVLGVLGSLAFVSAVLQMSDSEYPLSFTELTTRVMPLMPSWYKPVHWTENIWMWGELIVLLTNRKRRALHDFIAGTVVVHSSSIASSAPLAPAHTAAV